MKFKYILFIITIAFIMQGCNQADINQTETNQTNQTAEPITQVETTTQPTTEAIKIDKAEEFINTTIQNMTLEQKIGQLFIIAIRTNLNNEPQLLVDENIISILNTYNPAGFILFKENIDTVNQVQQFIYDLQSNSKIPLFIGIDEEGGRVSRLQGSGKIGATILPSSRAVGKKGDTELAYEIGKLLGKELSVLGFNMDFAPVADINTNPNNPVIGDRAFGSEPQIVSEMVKAEIQGIQDNNISAVIKHFPGHGDTQTDTHTGAVYLDSDLQRLVDIELKPFEEGIKQNVDGIMVSHIILPNVTGNNIPSSLSKQIITDILRNQLQYTGLIITDALDMGAIALNYKSSEAAKMAVNAGIDLLLMPQDLEMAYNSIYEAVKSDEIPISTIDNSLKRILKVKYKRDLFSKKEINTNAFDILGCEEHQSIVNKFQQ